MNDYEVMMEILCKGQGSVRREKHENGSTVFINRIVQFEFDKDGNYITVTPTEKWEDIKS